MAHTERKPCGCVVEGRTGYGRIVWCKTHHEEEVANRDTLRNERDMARTTAKLLQEICNESNAVCACGCPADEHESYEEDGECCGYEDHECVRTSQAVLGMLQRLRAEVERLTARLSAIRTVVDAQAEDDGLWFIAATAPEAYLQQELRRLHAVVEDAPTATENTP